MWLICFIVMPALPGQATGMATEQEKPANRLLGARVVAVVSMPDGLDRWLIDDLRAWGRYRVTLDAEGADLVMRGYDPQKELEYKMKRGIPQPKHEKHEPPPVLSITVIDWVSNQPLWQADVLNKKAKEGQPDPAPGPQTQIDARGLTPEQLAHKVAARLRQYVTELERSR
jgi:hypothetical protein